MAAGFIGGEAQDQAGELDGPLSCAAPQPPVARADDPADWKRSGTGWTDRRPAGGQELHHRSRFDSIAALSPDAIICANDRNLITSWNRAAEQIFGYTEAEIVGASLSLIVPMAFRRMHENGLSRVAAGSTPTLVGKIMAVPALRRDGTEFPIELSLTAWQENGRRHFGAIIRDITERRAAEETLRREADFDFLTGVANRRLLSDRLREASGAGKPSALILFDLDGFKDVNDSLGHAAGDEILRVVAQRLQASAGENTLVARMGGDEFAVFAWGQRQAAKIEDLAQRLVAEIEKMILFESRCIYVGASAGIVRAETGGWRPEDLLRDADLALYRAKAEGRSHVRLFTPDLRSIADTRVSISSSLRRAWAHGKFQVFYQPQVRLSDQAIVGAEALLRWNCPEKGLLSPAAFLGVLETSLLAGPVSEWILGTALDQAQRLRRAGLPQFRIGVNLFPGQFMSGDLPRMVERALKDRGLPGDSLELEITENTILRSDSRIHQDLVSIRALGVGIAFDDYGTGYASLTMLKDYPVTRLKIDRSFVAAIERSPGDQIIIESIAKLARGFDLQVIAEGIESLTQARVLQDHCHEGQGYYFGHPMPAGDFEQRFLPSPSLRVQDR